MEPLSVSVGTRAIPSPQIGQDRTTFPLKLKSDEPAPLVNHAPISLNLSDDGHLDLYRNFNYISVRSFIPTGAPVKLLSGIAFFLRGHGWRGAGLQLVCKLCSL
jgi:hypothetical protein